MPNPEILPIKSTLYDAIASALSRGITRQDIFAGIGIDPEIKQTLSFTEIEFRQVMDFVEGHLAAIPYGN